MKQSVRAFALVAAFVPGAQAVGLSGCGGGAQLRGDTYRTHDVSYRVGTLDAEWSRLRMQDNHLAWERPKSNDLIQVNARCVGGLDVPLQSLTQHLLIGFTEREYHSASKIQLDGREALRTRVRAKLDGVARELVLYVLKKDQCVYDFALVASPGEELTRVISTFDNFVSDFATLDRSRG